MNLRAMAVRAAIAALVIGSAVTTSLGVGAVLRKSGPIQITADGATVWAVNPDHDSVSRLATAGNTVTQFALPSIGIHHAPRGLAVLDSGAEIWVACPESDRVYVLNGAGAVLSTLAMPAGSAPIAVAISPDQKTAIAALHNSAGIAVFDVPSHSLVKVITGLYRTPWGLCFVSPTEAWVSHTMPDGEDSHMTRVDPVKGVVTGAILLKSVNPKNPADIPNDPIKVPEGGYLMLRGHIAKPPGINQLWMPVQYQNFHNTNFSPDSTVQSAIHKIDLANGRPAAADDRVVLTAVYAHKNDKTLVGPGWDAHIAGPVDLAFSGAGTTAYLVCDNSNDVTVFPTNIPLSRGNNPPLPEIPVGDNPIGIAASPVNDRVYVLNYLSRDVSVINTVTLVEEARVPITPGTREPLAPDVLLGAKVFNSAADPRMSATGKVSCASCHPNGESDGHTWAFAPLGAGQRKTLVMKTVGVSFGPKQNEKGQLHRAGDRDEVQDFEFTARSIVMGGTGFIAAPNQPLGAPNAGKSAELDGLAAYILSLNPDRMSPHRAADGTLPENAVRGGAIFTVTNANSPYYTKCIACHVPPAFTDKLFWDVGGFAPPPENQGKLFNTPSLAGAWSTAPYVQGIGAGGDAGSLGGFVRNAKKGVHGNTSKLNRAQLHDLSAFLECIDGQMVKTGIGGLVDTSPPRIQAVLPVSINAVEIVFSEAVEPASAGAAANYAFTDGVKDFPATKAVVDAVNGNRVRVTVPLAYHGCPVTYTLVPGPVQDVAGLIAGGQNNTLDTSDPANHKSFTIDGSITVTWGDTGNETFPSAARDAAFSASSGSLSFGHMMLFPYTSPETKGFVGFDFVPRLTGDCAVTDPKKILGASFSALPLLGHANTVELRRCLMPWGEPPNDFCSACSGAVTLTYSQYQTVAWHQQGAAKKGGTGTDPSEYYPVGANDVTASVDATTVVGAINERAVFGGAPVTDAFRFWLANPGLNFGWSGEVVGNNNNGVEFLNTTAEDGKDSLVLSITFAVDPTPGGCGCYADCDGSGGLDIDDFICFQTLFGLGDASADCDGSGGLDIDDFICFQTAFGVGCP